MNKKRRVRTEIETQYQWDLTKCYQNTKEWETDYEQLQPLRQALELERNKIMLSSSNLLTVLKKQETIERLLEKLSGYAFLKYSEDTTNNEANILKAKIEKKNHEIATQLTFINSEILKVDYKLCLQYIAENAELKKYDFYLEQLFRLQKHKLSEKEEKLLARTGEILGAPRNMYTVFKNADLKYGSVKIKGEEIEITEANYIKLLQNKNREVRAEVFKRYYKTYETYNNTLAEMLKYNVKSYTMVACLRNFNNYLEMSLYNQNIDLVVYDNLITTVNNNLGLLHQYMELRQTELKLKQLQMYDLYVPLTEDNKEYSYEEAEAIVKEALKPLGADYLVIVNKIFKERLIDVYDNVGKTSGAYSLGIYDFDPYILLNYNQTLGSVATLIHEIGHSVHSYYTNNNESYFNSRYSIFTAEIASTVNEILLMYYLLNNTTDCKQKRQILNLMLESFKGSIFRQTMFAEFERELFQREQNNEVLTATLINEIYYNLNKKYSGSHVVSDEEIRLEWCRIPHFYRPYYVYQYATGLSAAWSIATEILKGNQQVLQKYKVFLASGNNDYPLNLLKKVGVDFTTPEPILKALAGFADLIQQYKTLE